MAFNCVACAAVFSRERSRDDDKSAVETQGIPQLATSQKWGSGEAIFAASRADVLSQNVRYFFTVTLARFE